MAERLTKRTPKGASLKLDNPRNEAEARKQLMGKYKIAVDKLAYYEDLEEAGRLIILPDGINFNKLVSLLTNTPDSCPGEYSLKNRCELSCLECWLAALKGAEE